MSRAKYKMTDAAAKRIAVVLAEKGMSFIQVRDVEQALRAEDFWGSDKANYVKDLCQWLTENKMEHLALSISQSFIRDYYSQKEGIHDFTSGLMRLGVIPYPDDDRQ